MLQQSKTGLLRLALAGTLAVGLAGAAMAQSDGPNYDQQWSYYHHGMRHYHHYRGYGAAHPHVYDYGAGGYSRGGLISDRSYGGYYPGYYSTGYYSHGPVDLGSAVVGTAFGIADTAAATATGYPYDYYRPAYDYYGYDNGPYYGGPGYW